MSKFTLKSRLFGAVAAVVVAIALLVGVSYVTKAQAQSLSLSQLVDLFVSMGIISPDKAVAAKAAVASSVAPVFTRDLTVGSSGADVSALQTKLGVTSTGTFGNLTKAAVKSYQAANGISSTGYVGPITRASLNSVVVPAVVTPVTSTPAPVVVKPVVNSGIEGILTVDQGSVSNSTLYVGQSQVPVLSVKVGAKLSDIAIQRVQLDLGNSTTIYTKVFKTLYVTDDSGKVLAQADLNSNTVVKSGSSYLITLGGFSYTIAKDAQKLLVVKADLYPSVDSTQLSARTFTVPANGIRGTDGAGIDQYGPSSSFAQAVSLSGSLTDSAQLLVSTDSANFKTADVVAAGGVSNDQYDKLPLLALDLRAQKDLVQITDMSATISVTGSAEATAAYLYDGENLIGSSAVVSGVAKFTNINYVVPQDSTNVLIVKADIRNATAAASTFSASVSNSQISSENSQGSTINSTGSAAGENMIVRNVGPVFVLQSSYITKSISPSDNNSSTSTADATFNLKVTAVGGDITFGTQAASSTFNFEIYQNGGGNVVSVGQSVCLVVSSFYGSRHLRTEWQRGVQDLSEQLCDYSG